MQLFITNYTQQGEKIIIENKDILNQIRKVLRMKLGDICFVQNNYTRHQITITDRNNDSLTGEIIKTETSQLGNLSSETYTMCIAMPNKRQKAELITQKLSEIGIRNIIFRIAERSIIKEANTKKLERLEKISKEAVEQSRGRTLPEIKFVKDIGEIIQDKEIIVFDKNEYNTNVISSEGTPQYCGGYESRNPSKHQKGSLHYGRDSKGINIGIIGPEGGLTQKDYTLFKKHTKKISIQNLGDTILRAETAAIIGGRTIKNKKL